jgi:CNT family concentrative nucleoside transporter
MLQVTSGIGLMVMILIAWLLSSDRKRFPWRVVSGGVALQFVLAILLLKTPQGRELFQNVNLVVDQVTQCVMSGSKFVFGVFGDEQGGPLINTFAFRILPTVIFYSSLMAVLYHLGIMQQLVRAVAFVMQRTLGTSGPETVSVAANIFVGQTEAPILVKPYISKMTISELNAMMIGGFATVTGSLLVSYINFGAEAGHLMIACIISAPAALAIAKVMQPEEEGVDVNTTLQLSNERTSPNVIGAAAQGASDGLILALNIAAMLIAFLALVALMDLLLGTIGSFFGFDGKAYPTLSLSLILGYLFAPMAWIMGVESTDCLAAGRLLGLRTVANEFLAFSQMKPMLEGENPISERTRILMTYALAAFANISSIGIQVGGIGAMAPDRKADLARLGWRAMIGGTLAANMTACIAGILI